MSGTMDDNGQVCLCFACALEDDVPAGLPVGATSAADLGWRREKSYKMAEQIARRSSRGITGVHHQHKSPFDDDGPRTSLQNTSGPLVQRRPVFVVVVICRPICLPTLSPSSTHWQKMPVLFRLSFS